MSEIAKPRPISQAEQPKAGRAPNIEKAKETLYNKYPDIMKQVANSQKIIDSQNEQNQQQIDENIFKAAMQSLNSGKQFTREEQLLFDKLRPAQTIDNFNQIFYTELDTIIKGMGPTVPDIDEISPFSIEPGSCVQFWGSGFGPSQGKILFEIEMNALIELDVSSWTDSHINATLNRLYGSCSLRQYYGRIWIMTGNGVTSNFWPMMFVPIQSLYFASWSKNISGGVFGSSDNGVLLEGVNLGDGAFNIQCATFAHWGSGDVSLRAPNAGGSSYSQGYHYGINAFKSGGFSITYHVSGPKGINPPQVNGLSPWYWVADLS